MNVFVTTKQLFVNQSLHASAEFSFRVVLARESHKITGVYSIQSHRNKLQQSKLGLPSHDLNSTSFIVYSSYKVWLTVVQ